MRLIPLLLIAAASIAAPADAQDPQLRDPFVDPFQPPRQDNELVSGRIGKNLTKQVRVRRGARYPVPRKNLPVTTEAKAYAIEATETHAAGLTRPGASAVDTVTPGWAPLASPFAAGRP